MFACACVWAGQAPVRRRNMPDLKMSYGALYVTTVVSVLLLGGCGQKETERAIDYFWPLHTGQSKKTDSPRPVAP